jgi:predicted dehydrogenase
MIRIALIGAGAHASGYHFPALIDHQLRHPNSLQITAVCDKDPARAAALATVTGAAVLDSWQDALDLANAVIACVPPSLTPEVARTCAQRDLPLLMEKPLASTLSEAEALVADLAGARVMASMNRHFDPTVTLLRQHLGDRIPRLIRITQSRNQRLEPEFLPFTGIHVVDLAIFLSGAPEGALHRHDSHHHGARWTDLHWTTATGTRVEVAIKPTLGCNQERVEVVGDGWEGESRSAWMDDGTVRWQDEIHRLPQDWPDWKKAGTDRETDAFLAACHSEGAWEPTPASVLVATKLLGA